MTTPVTLTAPVTMTAPVTLTAPVTMTTPVTMITPVTMVTQGNTYLTNAVENFSSAAVVNVYFTLVALIHAL